MASTPKPKKAKGKGLSIVLCVIGIILMVFSMVWLTIIWPTMTKIPTDLDKDIYQEGYFYPFNPQQPGQFITQHVVDRVNCWVSATVDNTVILHETHNICDYDTGNAGTDQEQVLLRNGEEMYARDQIVAVNRSTGMINTALQPYVINDTGAASGGYFMNPKGLGEGVPVFSTFHPGTESLRPAYYQRDEVFTFDGKNYDTVVYTQFFDQVPAFFPSTPPLPAYISGNITFWIDPETGTMLDFYADEYFEVPPSTMTRMLLGMGMPQQAVDQVIPAMTQPNGMIKMFINQMKFSTRSIEDAIDTMHQFEMMPLLGTTLPWTLFGLGAVLVIAGSCLCCRGCKQQQKA